MSDHQAIEVTVTTFANKTTFWSGLASAFGSLTSINWLSYTGAIVAVVGLFISFIFQWRRDRRERKESALREKVSKLREQESELRIKALLNEQMNQQERKDE
ncbi:holin [Acinetobacter pittii]|uniref:holin n=1 Tax=Acinetobacter pittii TaxID=48296 RepID=UPI001D071529|nr:holin [Acinetobacter pittii]